MHTERKYFIEVGVSVKYESDFFGHPGVRYRDVVNLEVTSIFFFFFCVQTSEVFFFFATFEHFLKLAPV